ncbi:MAG TPA: YdcF family protein [Candidatus Paceibacterota bacterium]
MEHLVVLGGGLRQDKSGRWRTTLGEKEMGRHGLLNDRLRVVAASALWAENKNLILIASGGKGHVEGRLPDNLTLSKVIKEELIELGVPAENIIEENKSGSTYEQLTAVKNMMKSGELSGKISIISNDYHLPRIKAMIEYTKLKDDLSGKTELVGAEDVLMKYKKAEWGDFIDKSKHTPAMIERLNNEKKGVEQIKSGTYKLE